LVTLYSRRDCHEVRLDFRRAGLFRRPEQRRRRPVWSSWTWLRRLRLRSRAELLRSGPVVRRSRRRAQLLRSGRRRAQLLRSGRRRAQLLRSRADLLPGSVLLQQRLLQAEEVPSELVRGLEEVPRLQEEPLLRHELLRSRADLLRSGPVVRRSRRRADLRRSCRSVLPLVISELPGLG
jgi:hypothetical protein